MMFRGLLRCSFPCRHAATALVAATAAGVSAARMTNYNHTNTEANTLHDSLNDERLVNNSNNAAITPHMTRTRGPASHFTAYYSGAAPLPRRRPSVFAPMRRPQAYTRHTPARSNNTTTTTTHAPAIVQQDVPRRRVVMSKAQQIRQAARHMREAQRAQRVNSPAAYLILSATQEQLNREADLVSATLQRLQAEKALVQARQESAEDMQQFALGIEQRRRAVHNKDQCNEAQLNYSAIPYDTDNNANAENTANDEGMREGVYQAVISEPGLKQQHNTTQPSRAMTASAMEHEVQKTLAETVDATLLGLPATADHEAALAMQRRTSHRRKSSQTDNKKKNNNNSTTRDGNRRKKAATNTKKAVVAVQPARRRGRPNKQQQQQQTKKQETKKKNTLAKQRKPSQAPRRVGRPAKATSVRPQTKSRSRNTSTAATAGKKKKSASQKRTR